MWSASPQSTSYHCLYIFVDDDDDDDMEDEEGEEEEPKAMDEAVSVHFLGAENNSTVTFESKHKRVRMIFKKS